MKRFISAIAVATTLALAMSVSAQSGSTASKTKYPATAAGVKAFLDEVDRELLRLINASNRAGWVQSTYITPDTEVMAAQANEALVTAATGYAKDAFRFDKVEVGPGERRQLSLLKNELTVAAPPDPKEAERSEEHTSELQSLAYLVCRL